MFVGISHTTDYQDPQMQIRTFSREGEARTWLAEGNCLAWPGSGNFHKRLRRVVEAKPYRLTTGEKRAIDSHRWQGFAPREDHDACRALFERAHATALRELSADGNDTWLDAAYEVTARPSILDAAVTEITVTGPEDTRLRAEENDDVAWLTAKGKTELVFLDYIDPALRMNRAGAIEIMRRALALG
jgi:hypothetical protein